MVEIVRKLFFLFLSIASVLSVETDVQSFATGTRVFTGTVYNELIADNKDNLLVSPFSVETILALTQAGALGDTAKEIRTTLQLPSTEEETERVIKSVLPLLHSDVYTLSTANKIYVENNFVLKNQFKRVATDVFDAGIESIEFAQNAQAADTINQWVAEQTNNKIQNLLSSKDVDHNTRVVLINALYFKGNWSIPFKNVLSKRKFYTSADQAVDAEVIYKDAALYNYYESGELDAKILEIPFQGEDASMTIVLPNKNEGIGFLEKQVSSALVAPAFTREYVEVQLPKFQIETSIKFKDILKKLGVHKAFDVTADFSGIAGDKGDLIVDEIVQKTFIKVDKDGVEAAAATAVVTVHTAAVVEIPHATKTFIADHPFIFYIKVKGIILFEGRVLTP